MALGAIELPSVSYAFDSDGTAMVPVTANQGDKVLGKVEISSPMEQVSEFFAGIDKSLINLVEFAKKSFQLEEKDSQLESLERQDTDDIQGDEGKGMIASLKEAFSSLGDSFNNVSIGEKLGAALLLGSLLLFSQVQETLVPIVQKVVEAFQFVRDFVFGDTENPNANTFAALLGIFAAFKLAPLVSSAVATSKFLGGAMLTGLKKLGTAFTAMRTFIVADMIPAIFKTYGGVKGKLFTAITRLGLAFTALRTFIVASMIPAITGMVASLAPMLVPLLPVIAIVAGAVAVLYSLKSGFEAFKTSLEEGDSMLTAIGKGLLDFSATLVTLPLTLLKGIVSYFAGIFGFDNFKKKLDNFSFKDGFINIITGFVNKVKDFFAAIFDFDIKSIIDKIGDLGSKIANTLKAIAKGAVAMVAAAVPGGESPTEAFSRVYNEVLNTGEGVVKNEAAEVANAPLVEDGAMAAAKAAMTTNEAYTTNNNTFNNTTNMMKEKIIELLKFQMEKLQIEREGNTNAPIMVNANKGGDTNVNNSTTNVSGEPNTDHSETTQKLLTYAI